MHSNGAFRIATDTLRLSPQTTSSSGYHSDLSSTHESPGSINGNITTHTDQYSCRIRKKTADNKLLKNKSLSQISNFIRKQYERAKSKLISEKQHTRPIQTCTKSTSTTPLSYLSQSHHAKSVSSNYRQSSFIEPVRSVYVHPVYDNAMKEFPSKPYTSMHNYYSQYPTYTKPIQNNIDSQSFRHSSIRNNFGNLTTGCCLPTNHYTRRHQYYSNKCQNYYPYKYINKNHDYNRSLYVPLSDFISTGHSAFKPVKISQQRLYHTSETIPPPPPSDDPCDLEVAQYFCRTPQWSNPNYFDIYQKNIPRTLLRKKFIETLC
ncbi:unnamed protein product [Adineta steineri]|uniref:Uncharacterized protein n=1 Tax=Adineta steineri TaxID=433720 RepID=A0A818HME6_9BILA|nr:unnamed protein product [Adineta steineri]CAF3511149.1 unnamed protein product [Adineta steineri]